MRLLVTGGAGFIGSNFIHYWLKNHPSDQIINFDNLTYAGNLENLESVKNSQNYTFTKGDIANAKEVRYAIKNVDVVVNFAAESHVDRSILDPAPFILTNVVGTQVLLDVVLKNQIKRFHHVSTDEVYGALDLASDERFNENTPYNPNSPYAASKAASDHLVRAYFATYKLPITISNLLEDKKVPIYGDGLYVRDWLYVEDHCSAIDLILQKGKVGETYCIGDNNDIPNIEVIKKILRILELSDDQIEYVADRLGHDRKYTIDATKIKKELGWQPKYDFDQSLELTVKWYQDNQSWWKKLKDKKFAEYYERQYVRR